MLVRLLNLVAIVVAVGGLHQQSIFSLRMKLESNELQPKAIKKVKSLFRSLSKPKLSPNTNTIQQSALLSDRSKPESMNHEKITKQKTSSKKKEDDGIFLDVDLFDRNVEDLTEPTRSDFKSGFVCIAGNPNVGKSTLLNAILGQKLNIVSPKPQTTRHRIHGILTEDDYQIVFTDTPGMLKPVYKMQETMRDVVRLRSAQATIL